MEFTKQERHEIYKEAYSLYIDEMNMNKTKTTIGMCHHMAIAMEICFPENNLQTPLSELYEFDGFRPLLSSYGEYWWASKDIETRKKIFEKIIEMTK